MAYVITEACIGTKNTACVSACPVDCIYDEGEHYIINPEECIDCSMCMPECPVEAIYPTTRSPRTCSTTSPRPPSSTTRGPRRASSSTSRTTILGDNVAEMKQRSLEEVKTLSAEEAVEIMRQAGIVGAGGGGFPTYFKYKAAQPHLIVNTESEPGYWGTSCSTRGTSRSSSRFPRP